MSKPPLSPIMQTGELRHTPKAQQGPGIAPKCTLRGLGGKKTAGRCDPKKNQSEMEELKRSQRCEMERVALGVRLGCFGMEGGEITVGVMGSEDPVNERMKVMGPCGGSGGGHRDPWGSLGHRDRQGHRDSQGRAHPGGHLGTAGTARGTGIPGETGKAGGHLGTSGPPVSSDTRGHGNTETPEERRGARRQPGDTGSPEGTRGTAAPWGHGTGRTLATRGAQRAHGEPRGDTATGGALGTRGAQRAHGDRR